MGASPSCGSGCRGDVLGKMRRGRERGNRAAQLVPRDLHPGSSAVPHCEHHDPAEGDRSCKQSYTTFVAATIHVRIAAQRGSSSEAARSLGVCLEALEENAATNTGVRKMFSTISGLMGKLGVVLPSRSEPPGAASTGELSVSSFDSN